jgi:hypothetical protein
MAKDRGQKSITVASDLLADERAGKGSHPGAESLAGRDS